MVFEILTLLATTNPPTAVTAENFELAISLANDFATSGSIGSIQEKRRDFAAKRGHQAKPARQEDVVMVQRAVKAVGLIHNLSDRVPTLINQSHLERHEAWAAYWSPVFRALVAQCVNPCREVRHRALSALQRTLLSEAVADEEDGHAEWTAIFDEVLFPMTLRLLKPEIYQLDPVGMNDTRAQDASLLCKIFLRYLDRLATATVQEEEESGDEGDREKNQAKTKTRTKGKNPRGSKLADVWVKTLELLDRLMNAGTVVEQAGDALAEAVREGVKNTLLVMDGAGYLSRANGIVRDAEAEKAGQGSEEAVLIWTETVRRLDRFLPGLVPEVFPDAKAENGEGQGEEAGAQGAVLEGGQGQGLGQAKGSRPQTRDGSGEKR